LVFNDILGGDLMVGEGYLNGEQHGFHIWNQLPSGIELNLTREQFQHGEIVTTTSAPTCDTKSRWVTWVVGIGSPDRMDAAVHGLTKLADPEQLAAVA
jgi:hypothetical protein